MILLSHPTGNANVRNALLAFEQAGKLRTFSTALAFPECFRAGVSRHYPIPWDRIRLQPWREVARLGGARLGWRVSWASVDAIYHALDRKGAQLLSKDPAFSAVYTYEDGALATLRKAQKRGLPGIYELPIAYGPWAKERLLISAKKRPDWTFSLGGLADSAEKLQRKRDELAAASVVICPSKFVRDSLPDDLIRNKPVFEIPYGADAPLADLEDESRDANSDSLKVLFVGSMSQRKGLADVLDAFKRLGRRDVQLHILGSPLASINFYRKEYPDFVYHPPCTRDSVLKLMRTCDVFMLPSLIEGRALVQLEALACGLPLVVTANAGGEDLIVEGETGFLVEPESPDALIDRIRFFAEHRKRIPAMRKAAITMAKKHSWEGYRSKLITALRPIIDAS